MSSWRSSATTERLAVARISGAKGLAGAVRIELLTDWPERVAAGALVYLEGEERPRRVLELQAGGRVPVIMLEALVGREPPFKKDGTYPLGKY